MAGNGNLRVLKCAVLLNKIEVQAIQWRRYFTKNWFELTAHLRNATILFLTGRHGLEDGSIGPQDERVKQNQIQQVRKFLFRSFRLSYKLCFRMHSLKERNNSALT